LAMFAERTLWLTLPMAKMPLTFFAVIMVFFSATAGAQSPGPRDFLNTPVNQAVAWVDYVSTSSETVVADLPLPNNQFVSQVVAPTLLVSFPMNHRYAGLTLTVPYSKVEVNGPAGKVETSGFNDPAIAFHKNIFGLPALPRERIGEWVPKTFLSFHFTVNPPLGEYDRNSTVNTGANRWAFTPLFNLNIPLSNGAAWIELYAWGRFFTDNNEFQGNKRLSQDPLGVVALYYSHNIGKKMYAAIGGYYDYGGESFVNHVAQHDIANGFRPSVGISRKFGKFRVGLRYENTATKPNAVRSSALLVLKVSLPPLFKF
jgi:hypothetical protein